jgi:hypothetical protein
MDKFFVENMILGSLLGDGSVEKPCNLNKNYILSFHQDSKKEFNYITFKNYLISKYFKTNKIRKGNNNTLRFSISSKEKKFIDNVREKVRYEDNSRKFPDINDLNEVSLLFWYLDDGSLSVCEQKRKNRKNSVYRKLRIHLQSYRDYDILNFLNKLNLKFNLSFKPFYQNIKGEKKIVSIGISNNIKEISKFLEIIYPYKDIIPFEMHYKFCLAFHKTQTFKNNFFSKYNICNFHETAICQCREKNFSLLY